MVHLIIGHKGKGKTRELLNKVNAEIKSANGNIVFLDKDTHHMYELNNKIRLIDVSGYGLRNSDEFIGFISGIISQDHDLQSLYLDAFMKCAKLEGQDVTAAIKRIDEISTKFDIDVVISLSLDISELNEELKDKVIIAL